ncbi:hypothetical protein AUK40_04200 [Candidatus Wirthbacteria bacterium CG2_30_54_11]|uniref:Uncharacterized protein n=1 Tax=Candidatus Wirthbacteria bacterium CG2_30_54_11 TaxID=1817892 RepID=A0A1J5IIQ6_9BACT|nr:MAG: hypothetical protein AUK40_04200 [Candidatus Wirthbacteria bacterium CG2_30_54_11]
MLEWLHAGISQQTGSKYQIPFYPRSNMIHSENNRGIRRKPLGIMIREDVLDQCPDGIIVG